MERAKKVNAVRAVFLQALDGVVVSIKDCEHRNRSVAYTVFAPNKLAEANARERFPQPASQMTLQPSLLVVRQMR